MHLLHCMWHWWNIDIDANGRNFAAKELAIDMEGPSSDAKMSAFTTFCLQGKRFRYGRSDNGKMSSSRKKSLLNGQIPVVKKHVIGLVGVTVFGSDCSTIEWMPYMLMFFRSCSSFTNHLHYWWTFWKVRTKTSPNVIIYEMCALEKQYNYTIFCHIKCC